MGNAKGTELEIKPSARKDDLRGRNTMDVHKIGFNTRENKVIRFLGYFVIMNVYYIFKKDYERND